MNIGLIAHDSKKALMQNFCIAYRGILSKHSLYATGTTGRLIEEVTNLKVHKYLAGPLGGKQQLGAQIAQNDTHITYRIDNRYDIPFLLSYGKSKVLLSPNRSLDIKLEKTVDKLKLDLENVFVDEFQTLSMSLSL